METTVNESGSALALRNLLTMARYVERDGESRWTRNALTAGALLTVEPIGDGIRLSRELIGDEQRDDVPDEHAPILDAEIDGCTESAAIALLRGIGVPVVTVAEREAAAAEQAAKERERVARELVGVLNQIRSALKRGGSKSPIAAALLGDGGKSAPVVAIAQSAADAGAVLDEPMAKTIESIRSAGGTAADKAMDAIEELIPSAESVDSESAEAATAAS